MTEDKPEYSGSRQLQIRLVSTEERLAVPTTSLSVPSALNPEGLGQLVRKLLQEADEDRYEELALDTVAFDFFLLDDLVRHSLAASLETRPEVTTEGVLEVKYARSQPPPEPHKSVNHDDWVAGVACLARYVLTACYDSTVNIFDVESGEKCLTVPGHEAPARAVTWVNQAEEDSNSFVFASAAHDQSVLLYRWDAARNAIETVNALRGHSRSVDCIAARPSSASSPPLLASGSFDATLKIWGAKPSERADDQADEESHGERKKLKSSAEKPATRTPITTLAGHREGITGVAWLDDDSAVTCSLDHTIKVWDVAELKGVRSELAGDRAFLAISYSPQSRLLLTASADSAVRSYDPRAKSGDVLVRSRYSNGAPGWVTSVCWRKDSEHLFVSGGHDAVVRVWDSRSARTPLYELRGHEDRVLAVNWSFPEFVASGGADCSMKMFKTEDATTQ